MTSFSIECLSSPEFEAAAGKMKAVIIPFGSLEAHGPHLPLGTDTMQVEAVASMVSERTGVLLAPAVPYGVCLSTREHPGTVTLTTETLKSLFGDLVNSFHRQGINIFIIISGHAGRTHLSALRDAAEAILLEESDIKIALISEYDLIREKGSKILTTADDRHAGELETSRISHLAPDLVKGSAPEEYPKFHPYVLTTDKKSSWPGSVWGNPEAADAKKGKLLLEKSVEEISSVIMEMIND